MTAQINPLNAIRGPANIWGAVFGVTEPAATNAAIIQDPGAGWTFLGATQGGCTWTDDQTVEDTEADQVIDSIGGSITKRNVTVTFSLLEATLSNLSIALNRMGTLTVGTGITTYSPGQPNAGTIPIYSAIIVDGQGPQISGGGQARRRGIFRKLLNTGGKVAITSDTTKNGLIPVTFKCYGVTNNIDPYFIQDQTA